jgi:hypothetical protein
MRSLTDTKTSYAIAMGKCGTGLSMSVLLHPCGRFGWFSMVCYSTGSAWNRTVKWDPESHSIAVKMKEGIEN